MRCRLNHLSTCDICFARVCSCSWRRWRPLAAAGTTSPVGSFVICRQFPSTSLTTQQWSASSPPLPTGTSTAALTRSSLAWERSVSIALPKPHTVAPERIWKGGWHRSGAKVGGTGPARILEKNPFFGRAPPLFGSESTIRPSRFGERFCDCQYSLVSFLFVVLLLTVPPFPAICKNGGGGARIPRAPWSRRHWPHSWGSSRYSVHLFA